jgi:hypothetical protein
MNSIHIESEIVDIVMSMDRNSLEEQALKHVQNQHGEVFTPESIYL